MIKGSRAKILYVFFYLFIYESMWIGIYESGWDYLSAAWNILSPLKPENQFKVKYTVCAQIQKVYFGFPAHIWADMYWCRMVRWNLFGHTEPSQTH